MSLLLLFLLLIFEGGGADRDAERSERIKKGVQLGAIGVKEGDTHDSCRVCAE